MKARILIVDEDEGVRLTIEHVLANAGYQTTSAADDDQVIGLFEQFNPALVIVDLAAEKRGSLEIIAKLKQSRPALKIIAISAGARSGDRNLLKRAKGLGAEHILFKPFDFEQLAAMVERSCVGQE